MTNASSLTQPQPPAPVAPARRKRTSNPDGLEPSRYSLGNAWRYGDAVTRLSFLVFGLGNLLRRQFIKGLLFLAVEIAVIAYLSTTGATYLGKLPSLGDSVQTRVKIDGFWTYKAGDNSVQILLYGVMALFVIALAAVASIQSAKSAYRAQLSVQEGHTPVSFVHDMRELGNSNAHIGLMFLPTLGILVFTILPLVFMISMAFTNYDKNHVVLFDWVGLKNFAQIFSSTGSDVTAGMFVSVLAWTLVWAFFATFLNFFLGMFMAMLINRQSTRLKGLWRACFSMSIAVPQFVSLLVMNTMLQRDGAINRLLLNAGLINGPLPFLQDANWARATVIIINLWVGIPYTIMQITGILQNVPVDLYEAAELDGANWWQRFANVTMPFIFFVMTPYLITTFTGNVNNFNVIYLLTGGNPTPVGASAGKTDLLITWLYKLTVDKNNYNLGAVIGIMTFIVLAVISLITYRNSGSYKNEGGFQ
ncbi:carbohydrate ABC transporter permease [Bifidobacterium sp.]|uniref:carbohydrate ABC transporter permease n=1 Tax=Bifidobacterium sp. TaxID=41200 RepID=UPI0025C1DEF8|nr:sugar ABC transporter permease [Bifidobacterium sp.]MCH4210101.1 sugar ABC transporter permease [Bifidobacterium sp.]MCI1225557.1 sugar ABC transporter permease [Bifidobacterium sp.]